MEQATCDVDVRVSQNVREDEELKTDELALG